MRVWAKSRFAYNGQDLEPGQVFELIGARNDAKLLGLRYCFEITKATQILNCTCGLSFVGQAQYNSHLVGAKHPKEALVLSS